MGEAIFILTDRRDKKYHFIFSFFFLSSSFFVAIFIFKKKYSQVFLMQHICRWLFSKHPPLPNLSVFQLNR